MLGKRLLGEAGGLADELEQIAGDEALAWSSIRSEPAAGTCRLRGNYQCRTLMFLSAAMWLFLALLSGRPELVLPVSGTGNRLILTSHYDGPTPAEQAVERRKL
jgi:hypothetical protein